jgi:hypothetical protein
MSNLLLFKAIPIVTATGSGGAANLASPDPKEIWTGSGSATVNFSGSQVIDSVFVGFLGSAGSVNISGFGAFSAAASARTSPKRRHAFRRLGLPFSASSVTISSTSGSIGIVAFGLAFQPAYNQEWGAGRFPIDTGAREPLLGGGFGIGKGAKKTGYRWTLGDIQQAEIDQIYEIGETAGETEPIVVVEDPDATTGLNERLHYGVFDKLEPYERQNPSQTRWNLQMIEWV